MDEQTTETGTTEDTTAAPPVEQEAAPVEPTPEERGKVPIPEATDEDIEAFLKRALEEEAKANETPEKEPAADDEEEKPKEEPPAQKTSDDTVTVPKKDWDKINRQLETQKTFISRRGTEIGDLKKALRQENEQLLQDIEEKWADSPVQTTRIMRKVEQNEARMEQADREQQHLEYVHQQSQIIAQHLNDDEADLEGMVETLREDKVPEEQIVAFRQNPAAFGAPIVIHLAKRTKDRRILKAVVEYTKKLYDENQTLKAKPKEVLSNVEKASKQTRSMRAARNGASQSRRKDVSEAEITSMSDEELHEFLQNAE